MEEGREAVDGEIIARHELVHKREVIDVDNSVLSWVEIEQHEKGEEAGVHISGILRIQDSCLLKERSKEGLKR